MGKEVKGVTSLFTEMLMEYHWPGNVRELENTIRKAIAFTKTKYLTTFDIDLTQNSPHKSSISQEQFGESLRDSVKELINSEDSANIYRQLLKDTENIVLEEVMKATNGNRSKASRILGINRLTLLRKLKEAAA